MSGRLIRQARRILRAAGVFLSASRQTTTVTAGACARQILAPLARLAWHPVDKKEIDQLDGFLLQPASSRGIASRGLRRRLLTCFPALGCAESGITDPPTVAPGATFHVTDFGYCDKTVVVYMGEHSR